jgi:YjbE family integral membrane protein
MNLGVLATIGSIILIDLVLSGDNAIVIGMAASGLSRLQRRRAIVWGTLGAVGLRVVFTAIAATLLFVPLLQMVGGLILFWIAFKLLVKRSTTTETAQTSRSLGEAVRLIVTADAIMSLDNMLAVAAAAQGHFELIILGLGLSIPLLMIGAGLVAQILERLPWLVWLGGALIAWIAAQMILTDSFVSAHIGHLNGPSRWAFLAGTTGLTVLISWFWGRIRQGRDASQSRNAGSTSD